MEIFDKSHTKECAAETAAHKLYKELSLSASSRTGMFAHDDLGENMEVVNMLFINYWKPHYLLNHNTECAYEFLNEAAHLVGVSDEDIDWSTLDGVSETCMDRIKTRNALFPSYIGLFENGVAKVKWQINPDGRYWMDEDGYGMTADEEFNLYGFIDSACRVVVPFQAVEGADRLAEMRALAESIVAKK